MKNKTKRKKIFIGLALALSAVVGHSGIQNFSVSIFGPIADSNTSGDSCNTAPQGPGGPNE